jgi:hypothetical protein
MARFFFHLDRSQYVRDGQGEECATVEDAEARQDRRSTAGEEFAPGGQDLDRGRPRPNYLRNSARRMPL